MQSQPIPAGSFIPSEEAATKGMIQNDLRDRYDELQLKGWLNLFVNCTVIFVIFIHTRNSVKFNTNAIVLPYYYSCSPTEL